MILRLEFPDDCEKIHAALMRARKVWLSMDKVVAFWEWRSNLDSAGWMMLASTSEYYDERIGGFFDRWMDETGQAFD